MADITWLGDSYTNVPYVQLPQTGGGNASFYEESGTLTISSSGTQSVHTYANVSVPSGTAGTPTATKGTVSNHSVTVTPSVTNTTGFITGSTISGTAVTVSASELVSGNKEITSNGTDIDVANFSTVSVNVSGGGGSAVVVVDEQLPGGGTAKHITAVDISSDTVDAAHLATGYTAHDSSGNAIVGTMDGGGGGAEAADVNFIDYDGTIVQSYTASDFAALTALPSNPSHTGLTAQGWNWSLSDAKTYVASYGKLNIGQMYTTSSGDTEIDIELTDGRTSPYLGIAVNGTVTVDWGDNSATSTVTGTSLSTQKRTLHEYAAAGEYTISIRLSSGSYALFGSSTYTLLNKGSTTAAQNRTYGIAVKRVRIGGSGTTKIGAYAFNNCYGVESITIPSTITSIDASAFTNCFALKSLTIPSNVTSLPQPTANQSYNLTSLALPKGLTSIGDSAFSGCSNLKSVTLPSTVTSVGASSFATCSALETLIIPSGVTSVGNNAFKESYKLKNVTVPSTITSRGTYLFSSCRLLESVTNNAAGIGENEYSYCYNLTSVNILSGTTSIGSYAFMNCYNLTSLTIPSTVTSIGDYAFSTCYGLAKITIPSAVTSIGNYAFSSCAGLKEIHFQSASPPTVGASTFSSISPDLVIYVPTGKLADYTGAANYPSSSTYTYVEE